MNNSILICKNVTKNYQDTNNEVPVLKDVNLEVEQGEVIAIIGNSGSGKSTLLNILGVLDKQTSGEVVIDGINTSLLKDNEKSIFRNQKIGFVYQFHHLLPEFSALENVCMPLLIAKKPVNDAKDLAKNLLEKVGLKDRLNYKPYQLSGGERQRVAIARGIINSPKLVLMDEPTGNLDQDNSLNVQELIFNLANTINTSFLIVTHDINLAQKTQKIFVLEHGTLKRHD